MLDRKITVAVNPLNLLDRYLSCVSHGAFSG
jgi:hypothetical protein